jgi:cobyrinic acid a,c-diamide synthase
MTAPGLIIAAPRSGSGKTTVMLGLLAALRRRQVVVQPFKCGPDYIDPAFHAAASGRASTNLDSWAFGAGRLAALVRLGDDAGLVLAEGSMGLFDGVAKTGACGNGSNADIAAMTGWPVVLVLDVSGHAQSAAATALGFARYRNDISIAGVVLNRVSSDRHEALIRDGMQKAGMPVLGALRKSPDATIPERHLGLLQAEEDTGLSERLAHLAGMMEAGLDLPAIMAAARPSRLAAIEHTGDKIVPPGQRIALARDAAFSFIYPHLLAAWRAAGAEILPFSPLRDEAPDPRADVAWLPGGYPELHAGKLADAATFLGGLRAFARSKPMHGECGGYMVLGDGLVDAQGHRHAMAGLLRLETSFQQRKMHLGYRRATLLAPLPGCAAGTSLSGHEFHYASILANADAPLADVRDADGRVVPETGSRRDTVTGSFFHMIDVLDP